MPAVRPVQRRVTAAVSNERWGQFHIQEAEALSELMTLTATVCDQDEIFDKIKLAIHDRVTIEFEYRELDDRSTLRVVNPHLLGLMDNSATMDAYQIGGESYEGRLPGWRRFRLANIVRLKRSSNRFEPRAEFRMVPRRWKGVFESVNRIHRHIAGKRSM